MESDEKEINSLLSWRDPDLAPRNLRNERRPADHTLVVSQFPKSISWDTSWAIRQRPSFQEALAAAAAAIIPIAAWSP